MIRWQLALAVGLTLALIGCAPHREIIKKERTLTADEVMRRVRVRAGFVKTLGGSGTITVETREASTSGSFDVVLKKPDSLRVEFHGPFGIHVGTLTVSRDQFVFFNRRENTAVIGKPDGSTLQSMFHLKIRCEELVNAFAGGFPDADDHDSLAGFSVDRDLYVLLFRNANGTKEYRVDGDDFLVMDYRTLDAQGTATLTGFISRTTEAGDVTMPSLLRIIFPNEHRSITIAYDDIRVNEPVDCSFVLPKNVERIDR